MFNTLPASVICAIYDRTDSFTTATKLARCSRALNNVWKSHLATLDLSQVYDWDERWNGPKYRFFAVSIERARLDAAGKPLPSTNDAIKAGYTIAGIVNRTAAELHDELKSRCPDPSSTAAWNRWLEYVIIKSLYMLWIYALADGAPCDPEYWVDSEEMVGYLLLPRWREFGFPSLKGVKGVIEAVENPPLRQLCVTCGKLAERIQRNRIALGLDLDEDSEDELLPEEFYDDSELDDIGRSDESDDEFEDEEYSDDE